MGSFSSASDLPVHLAMSLFSICTKVARRAVTEVERERSRAAGPLSP